MMPTFAKVMIDVPQHYRQTLAVNAGSDNRLQKTMPDTSPDDIIGSLTVN